jgi:acyl carrier protein
MVYETIVKLLADRLDCDPSTIKPEDTFHDLGIDSLDTVDLLMNLEDELGISIELDEKVETVGDLAKFVESKKG